MIYKKDANFPYPILAEHSVGYEDGHVFHLAVELDEVGDQYRLKVNYAMTSDFLKQLIEDGKAEYLLVVQAKDNRFYSLSLDQMYVDIPQNKLSLSNRTSIQLHIVAKESISFAENDKLTPFYDQLKDEVRVGAYSMLGFSNIVTFEGGMKNAEQLFEKRINPNLCSAVRFVLESEFIVLEFRDEEYQLQSVGSSFMNPYLYMGLRVALERFIRSNANDDEDYVVLHDMEEPTDLLDYKLYGLMTRKSVEELDFDNVDEVIALISNGMIENYVKAVKGLRESGD